MTMAGLATNYTLRPVLMKHAVAHCHFMSALRPKADIRQRNCHVRQVPTADIPTDSLQESRIGITEFRSSDRCLFAISRIKPVYKSTSLKFIDER
jgi:hypothetical protein